MHSATSTLLHHFPNPQFSRVNASGPLHMCWLPRYLHSFLLTSFRSLLKCHLLREAFHNHPVPPAIGFMFDERICHCIMRFIELLIICLPHWKVSPLRAGIYLFPPLLQPQHPEQRLGVNTGWVDTRSGWRSPGPDSSYLSTGIHPELPWAEIKDFTPSGGSRKEPTFWLSQLLETACIPWPMASFSIFKVSQDWSLLSQTIALSHFAFVALLSHLVLRLWHFCLPPGVTLSSPR